MKFLFFAEVSTEHGIGIGALKNTNKISSKH